MHLVKKIKLFSEMVAGDFRFVFLPIKPIRLGLQIEGTVTDFEIKNDVQRNVVKVIANAEMKIYNRNKETIILINPKYLKQSTEKNFAITEADCKAENYLFDSLPSSDEPIISKEFNDVLEKILNEKAIDDLVFEIAENESISFKERIFFEFDADKKKRRWEEVGWLNLRSKINEIWFRYSYHPAEEINLLKPKLIELFPEQFGHAGQTPIYAHKTKDIYFGYNSIKTEPILIDFRKAKIDETKQI